MATDKRDFKGVWFPAEVWLDDRLTALEKMILMEIDSLDNDDGCFATNEYLAEFCQCSKSKVSGAVSKLRRLGYVRVRSFDGRKRVLESCLSFSVGQGTKNEKAAYQNLEEIVLEDSTSQSSNECMAQTKRRRFQPPTVDEASAYAEERGYSVDVTRFIDYYTANGWVQGRGKPIKDWRAALRNWARNDRDWGHRKGSDDSAADLDGYDFDALEERH